MPTDQLEHGALSPAARAESQLVSGVTLVSWDQEFFDPIILPGRKPLVTVRDAAQHITKLPKAEHDAEEW